MELEVIEALERSTGLEAIEFVAKEFEKFIFTGFTTEDAEAIIEVTLTGYVFVNGQETDIYLPFNAWSIEL